MSTKKQPVPTLRNLLSAAIAFLILVVGCTGPTAEITATNTPTIAAATATPTVATATATALPETPTPTSIPVDMEITEDSDLLINLFEALKAKYVVGNDTEFAQLPEFIEVPDGHQIWVSGGMITDKESITIYPTGSIVTFSSSGEALVFKNNIDFEEVEDPGLGYTMSLKTDEAGNPIEDPFNNDSLTLLAIFEGDPDEPALVWHPESGAWKEEVEEYDSAGEALMSLSEARAQLPANLQLAVTDQTHGGELPSSHLAENMTFFYNEESNILRVKIKVDNENNGGSIENLALIWENNSRQWFVEEMNGYRLETEIVKYEIAYRYLEYWFNDPRNDMSVGGTRPFPLMVDPLKLNDGEVVYSYSDPSVRSATKRSFSENPIVESKINGEDILNNVYLSLFATLVYKTNPEIQDGFRSSDAYILDFISRYKTGELSDKEQNVVLPQGIWKLKAGVLIRHQPYDKNADLTDPKLELHIDDSPEKRYILVQNIV